MTSPLLVQYGIGYAEGKVTVNIHHGVFIMNTSTLLAIGRGDFIELLAAEFTCAKGFGVYAFLSYSDIDALYHRFLGERIPATVFIRLFVKRFG